MRFGLFIPQGWRMDLVDIEPKNHWEVMRDLATYADGSAWDSLWDIAAKDEAGNVTRGDVLTHGVRNSYLRSEGPTIAAVGVDDLVVVATKDAVLVSHKHRAQDVKRIVDQLDRAGRDLHITPPKPFRP